MIYRLGSSFHSVCFCRKMSEHMKLLKSCLYCRVRQRLFNLQGLWHFMITTFMMRLIYFMSTTLFYNKDKWPSWPQLTCSGIQYSSSSMSWLYMIKMITNEILHYHLQDSINKWSQRDGLSIQSFKTFFFRCEKLSLVSEGSILIKWEINKLWLLYQEAEIVDPDPGVAPEDGASPGWLVHLLHCSNSNVWHRRVGQSKGDTDPLQTDRNKYS